MNTPPINSHGSRASDGNKWRCNQDDNTRKRESQAVELYLQQYQHHMSSNIEQFNLNISPI